MSPAKKSPAKIRSLESDVCAGDWEPGSPRLSSVCHNQRAGIASANRQKPLATGPSSLKRIKIGAKPVAVTPINNVTSATRAAVQTSPKVMLARSVTVRSAPEQSTGACYFGHIWQPPQPLRSGRFWLKLYLFQPSSGHHQPQLLHGGVVAVNNAHNFAFKHYRDPVGQITHLIQIF